MNIPENFDRWMFDFQEGNLSGAEKEAFENFLIQNPQFEVEADAWNNSFIQNEEFTYPNADKLEKDNRIVGGWYGYAAAAILLLLVGSSVVFFTQNNAEVDRFTASHEISDREEALSHANASAILDLNISALDKYYNNLGNHSTDVNIVNGGNNGSQNNPNVNNNNPTNPNLLVVNNGNNQSNSNANNGQNVNNTVNSSNGVNTTNNGLALNNNNLNSTVQNNPLDNTTASNSSDWKNPTAFENAMNQEIAKYEDDNHTSKYLGNPEDSDLSFDVNKGGNKYNVKGSKWKKFYHKLEKMFDYAPSLTNLRDPEFLLPSNSVVSSNPAFAGGMLRPRTEINYRNQWYGSGQNSQEMTISFDNYFYQMRGGVGIVLNAKDYQYGQFGDYNVSLMYSPKINIGRNVVFEPAVKMTIGALSAQGNQLAPESDFELQRGRVLSTPAAQQMQGNQQLWYKDYGVGFMLNAKRFYAGFSVDNLNQHFENVYNEEGLATPTSTPVYMNGIVGFDYLSSDKETSVSPFIAYQKFGARQELWAGTSCRLFDHFIFGGSVSQNLDFTAMLGMKFEKFKLAYQYDHTTPTLSTESFGSHNLTLRFTGKPGRIK